MASKKSLAAKAATAGMFTKAEETEAKPEIKKETAEAVPEKKKESAIFSVQIDKEILKRWRLYTSANGYGDKGRLTQEAIKEYMQNHRLDPEQEKKIESMLELMN